MSEKFKVCIIGVYFGKLPTFFNLWLKSCERNPKFDFLIIGDNKLENLPDNVKCINMSLVEMKERADKVLGFETALTIPYKCCDFKVIYGLLFQEYLEQYDFWGHCDFDMIFGDLDKFITDEILEKYDKILSLGHLSLYRNTNECNEYYKKNGSKCGNYKEIFTNQQGYAFDEKGGIYQIYKVNNLPMYDKMIYADIAMIYKRFRLALKEKNYKYQVFYWENGKVYRTYYDKEIKTEEFVYIHFKKRKFDTTLHSDVQAFFISTGGFVRKRLHDIPTLEQIKRINPYHSFVEIPEKIRNVIKYDMKRVICDLFGRK